MRYEGADRRVHTVFVTRNREYHTRDGICVAVRDLKTTAWMALHDAMGMEIESWEEEQLFQGRPLLFRSDNRAVETSTVLEIMRPPETHLRNVRARRRPQPKLVKLTRNSS